MLFNIGTSSENELNELKLKIDPASGYSSGAELNTEEMLLSRNPIKVNEIFRQALRIRSPTVREACFESVALPYGRASDILQGFRGRAKLRHVNAHADRGVIWQTKRRKL
jgi:hypothetical protein